ncbi:hypothetical protein DV738_g5187, partial [Chaetothyriales sp. CBS 135597]
MTSAPKRRLEALSEQLSVGIPSEGTYGDIPRIRHVAGPSTGPRAQGKVVIVTGTNSPIGIGRAAAHQFAANGAKADAVARYGRLDVMFANAGIVGTPATFEHISAEAWNRTFRVNTLGVFLCAKYAVKAMRVTGDDKKYPSGSIIATASTAGLRSNAGGTDYSASKAAVVSIAQTMSYQLAGTGIRINAICPGVVETGMTKPMYDMARERGTERKIGQLNPLQRGAVADEVARVALFLGSDEASYVTGQAWAVDGGLSAGHPFVPGKIA